MPENRQARWAKFLLCENAVEALHWRRIDEALQPGRVMWTIPAGVTSDMHNIRNGGRRGDDGPCAYYNFKVCHWASPSAARMSVNHNACAPKRAHASVKAQLSRVFKDL